MKNESIAIIESLNHQNVKLVAVSKTKPIDLIKEVYDQGQRIFGENRVPELIEKAPQMPDDVEWHMIGHLQRNKVRQLLPHVTMIHSIDSVRLLKEVNKEALKLDRTIPILLQLKIAQEETKYGFDCADLDNWLRLNTFREMTGISIAGVMGMASFVDDLEQVRSEFALLKSHFEKLKSDHFATNEAFREISMGMSGDYQIAIEEGSTMVRIGSLIFGARI